MTTDRNLALELTKQTDRAKDANDVYARVDSMSQMSGMVRSSLTPELDEALTELRQALSNARRVANRVRTDEESVLTSLLFELHNAMRNTA